MSGNILFGGAGNTAAKDFGEQDATILNVGVSVSKKYTQRTQDGRELPKIDLRIDWRGDDGKTVTCFYGGLYDAGNGDYSFGKNGKARSLVSRWSEATGRTPTRLDDLKGSRVRVAPKDTEFGGKVSWKLAIIGSAKNASAPVAAAPLFPTPSAPVAEAPKIDGAALYAALHPDVRGFIPSALKVNGDAKTAQALVGGGYAKNDAEALAIVQHVKTLGA